MHVAQVRARVDDPARPYLREVQRTIVYGPVNRPTIEGRIPLLLQPLKLLDGHALVRRRAKVLDRPPSNVFEASHVYRCDVAHQPKELCERQIEDRHAASLRRNTSTRSHLEEGGLVQ